MKTLILAAIRCSLMFLVTASLFFVRPAQAYTVTLEQVGSNVVANGSGPINLTGLTFLNSVTVGGIGVNAISGIISTGPTGSVNVDLYNGFTGPASFGSGGTISANTGNGDFVAIQGLVGGSCSCHRAMSPVLLYRIA